MEHALEMSTEPGMFQRTYPRAFVVLRFAYGALVLVLVAEIVSRVATYATFRAGLGAHPEIERRIAGTAAVYPHLTVEAVTGEPERWPAIIPMPDGPPRIEPFGTLPADAFREPLPSTPAPDGVVRIVFAGGSTTYDGYPEAVGERLRERFGDGRVEVVNLGIPASNSATSLVLMRRFLPQLRPAIVVVYHGFNDVVYFRARSAASARLASGAAGPSDPAIEIPPPSRGLLSWIAPAVDPRDAPISEAALDAIAENYEAMASLGGELGFTLWVSTFASPTYDEIDRDELDYFDAELTYLWPVVGSTDRYGADLARYHARVREVAMRRSLSVIDVAAAVRGGRATFADNCHLTEAGRALHADAVAAALTPAVERLTGPPP